jgi:hypothetical protein
MRVPESQRRAEEELCFLAFYEANIQAKTH